MFDGLKISEMPQDIRIEFESMFPHQPLYESSIERNPGTVEVIPSQTLEQRRRMNSHHQIGETGETFVNVERVSQNS